jgi:hypothetical protein
MAQDPYDELATPLGHFIVAFNGLEVALGGALMRLLKHDDEEIGAAFVAILGFSHKHALLTALAHKIPNQNTRTTFVGYLKEAKSINVSRNKYIHSEYISVLGEENEPLAFLHQRLKDSLKPNKASSMAAVFKAIQPVNPEDLTELANDASSLALNILTLSERFHQ